MRLIAGLDEPTRGRVRVNGRAYRSAGAPMAELGLLLEAKAVHTGRSARNHLLALAQTNGISGRRVDEVVSQPPRLARSGMSRPGLALVGAWLVAGAGGGLELERGVLDVEMAGDARL